MKQTAAILALVALLFLSACADEKPQSASTKFNQASTARFSLAYSNWLAKAFLDLKDTSRARRLLPVTKFIFPNFDLFPPDPVEGSKPGADLVSYGCPASKRASVINVLRKGIYSDDDPRLDMLICFDVDNKITWTHIPFGNHVQLVDVPDLFAIVDGKQPKEWRDLISLALVSWQGVEYWCPANCLGRSLPEGKTAHDLRLTVEYLRKKYNR